jgi:hypothetical protein
MALQAAAGDLPMGLLAAAAGDLPAALPAAAVPPALPAGVSQGAPLAAAAAAAGALLTDPPAAAGAHPAAGETLE